MRQSTAKTRMFVLGLLVPALVAVFLMVMFQMQVVNGDVYKEKVNLVNLVVSVETYLLKLG